MKWFAVIIYRSCNALVIAALLLGVLPPAQNVGHLRLEPPIARAQGAAMTPLEEVTEAPDGPDASADRMAERGVVNPSDLITYTIALSHTMGAVDEPAPSLNRAGGLLATKTADQEVASPGDLLTYAIVLTNTTGAVMEGLVVSDPLPDGLAYKPDSAEGGAYDPRTRALTWDIRELAAGASLSLTFQARVRGDVLGELVVNLAEVTGGGLAEPVQAQATVAVVSRALINPQGGVLVSRNGRVRVEFPGGAVPQPIWAIYRLREVHQLPPSQPGLVLRFDLTAEVATDENTAPPFTHFDKPVRLTVDMTELVDEAALGEYQRPFVGYLDEATGRWVPLPVVAQQVGPVLTVEVDHFSTFGGGVEGEDSMEGFAPDFIPSVTNAQPALFTGDATYALPLYVPPGPGGLQPDLTLRYSSGDVSEAWLAGESSPWGDRNESSQPGWLGQGWSLDFGVIVRDMGGQELKNATWVTHTYWLNMNSASGKLIEASDGYYYPEFAPQWRLKWTDRYRNGTWEAYGPDGTRYTFGASDGERMQVIEWVGCTPTPNYATMRWYLSEVEDRSGNTIVFTYDKKKRNTKMPDCPTLQYDRAMYPATITYGNSNVQIEFILTAEGTRKDFNTEFDVWESDPDNPQGPQVRFHKEMLDKIMIRAWDPPTEQMQVVRIYQSEYYTTSWGTSPTWLTLEQVRTVGGDGSSELPTMAFTYQNGGDICGLEGGHRYRRVLTKIDNGYGGRVEFDYDWRDVGWCYKQDCGTVHRFLVKERRAYDGIGSTFVQRSGYNYHSPTGNQERGEFWGHAKVEETVYDGSTEVAQTITEFRQKIGDNQLDPRRGRSKKVTWQEWSGSSWVELRRVENTWGFAGLPERSDDVWQAMLVASSTFHNDSVRDWTLYLEDIYGNPRAQLSYGQYVGTTSRDESTPLADVLKNEFFDTNPFDTNPKDWNTDGSTEVSISHKVGQAKVSEDGTNGHGVVWQQGNGVLVSGKKYYITAWVRAESGTTGEAQLYAHNGSSNWHGTAWELPDDEAWRLLQLEYTADGTGNIRIHLAADFAGEKTGTIYWDNVTITEVDTTGNDERTTYWKYYPNTTDWILDRVAQGTVYSGIKAKDDGEGKAAQTHYHYDMNDSVPRGWDDPPTEGLLTQEDRWDGLTWAETGYRYDDYGNLIQVIDPNDNTTTTSYDTVFHTFPITVTNAKLHQTTTKYYGVNGSSMTSTGAYFGQVESVTDPNEAETEYRYDVFGRLTKVIRPYDSDTDPTIEYVYDDFYLGSTTRVQALYRETSGCSACKRWVLTFYNGLGQKIQTKAEAKDGADVVVTNTSYDERGLVKEQSMPYFSSTDLWEYVTPDMSNKTSYEYDGLGRVLIQTNPDNTQIEHHYGVADGMVYDDVIDPNRHRVQYRYDAFGRLGRVYEMSGDCGYWDYNCSGQYNTTWAVYATTTYAYDALDNLTTVTDTLGNVTTMGYDMLGRKTGMTDPDMGTWSYGYDAAGNLTRQTDARGQTICFYYDALNRLMGKTYRTDTNCTGYGGYDVTYAYDDYFGEEDANAANSWGRRAAWVGSQSSNGHKYQYDERGRLIEETQKVNNEACVTQYTYRADDQVHTMTYPDPLAGSGQAGEVITTTYNAMGLPETLTSSLGETYVTDASYTPEGRLDLLSLGSNLQVGHDYYPWNTPNGQGRLESIHSGTVGQPTLLQNLSYVYDAVGNVQSLTDNGQTTTFSYDALDRLTGASGVYSESYNYNEIGNLTLKDGLVYDYDPDHPHAVKYRKLNDVVQDSFGYDLSGNMTSRTVDSTSYTLTYDTENRLQRVTNTASGEATTFTYDGDGQRVKRDTVTNTIVYVGSHYEVRFEKQAMVEDLNDDCVVNIVDIMLVAAHWGMTEADPDWDPRYDLDGDGEITVADIMTVAVRWRKTCEELAETVKYYSLGGRRVAMREGNTLYYLFSDHLGSVSLETDAGGGLVFEQRFLPFGDTRYAVGEPPTDLRFAGQRWDSLTQLYQMGSRWYDPQLGRWISPDPIVPNPGNPQSLNRYSYVYNRPLVYVDDSGHIPIIPIIVTIVVAGSKVVDYALTAYDAWQSGRVLADPNASRGDKLMAGLNVGLAAVFEALEPDDVLPVGLPADDVARRAVMTGAREAFEEGGEEALERFLRDTLGDQADDVIERMFREVGEEGAERAGQAYRFATGDKLMDHFRKHGAEFGYETAKQYLQGAQRLVSGEGIETFVRASGDTLFYDAATNEFAVLSKEGVIRTYFKPERGIEYWLTQIGGR